MHVCASTSDFKNFITKRAHTHPVAQASLVGLMRKLHVSITANDNYSLRLGFRTLYIRNVLDVQVCAEEECLKWMASKRPPKKPSASPLAKPLGGKCLNNNRPKWWLIRSFNSQWRWSPVRDRYPPPIVHLCVCARREKLIYPKHIN